MDRLARGTTNDAYDKISSDESDNDHDKADTDNKLDDDKDATVVRPNILLSRFQEGGEAHARHVLIRRPAMNQSQFHEMFEFEPPKRTIFPFGNTKRHPAARTLPDSGPGFLPLLSRRLRFLRHECSAHQLYLTIISMIPIITWLPKYKWRKDLFSDLMAGFTVGVMHVPQGLAYAMLANIDPIAGIYTAFFPVFIYILLGTSKHISMGTFAVISILVSKPVLEHCESAHHNHTFRYVLTSSNGTTTSELPCEMKVTVAITFLVGLIQLCMGFLKLGILSSLLSDALISGFTSGSAVHVLASQVPQLLGITIEKATGIGQIVKAFISVFENISKANLVSCGISVSCMALLLLHDFLVKPFLKKRCSFPIPVQFILVIVGTVIAWALQLQANYRVDVVGEVPSGMPSPFIPVTDSKLLSGVFVDSVGIALIAYVISLSLARIMAAKHKYQIDPNQELVAQGAANIFGSFFLSLPMAGSLSRTMVQESSGCRTLITSAVSVFLLLWVVLFIGPLFYHLPKPVLSAIIVISLFGIFAQFRDFFLFAQRSLSEAFVWLATFLCTVFLDINMGLLIGIVASLLCLVAWGYFPKIELVGQTEFQDVFLQADSFQSGLFYGDTVIVRISGNLNMANATTLIHRIEAIFTEEEPQISWLDNRAKNLLLDVSPVTHVDTSACLDLIGIYKHFGRLGLAVCFVGVRAEVWTRMNDCKVFDSIPRESFFPTLQDALLLIQPKTPPNEADLAN